MTKNQYRRSTGQALTLTIVSTIVLIILGVGFIYLMKIFGGAGEERNATDGGVLNLNKTAVGQSVRLPASYLSQHPYIAMYGKSAGLIGNDGSMSVSLATFNNLVGSALMVAMNASADGMAGNDGGQSNASALIKEIEVSDDSVAAKLKDFLTGSGSSGAAWAGKAFNAVALANSERMMGKDAQAMWDKSQYQVAYLTEPSGDKAASNVALDQFMESNLPLVYDGNGNVSKYPTPKSLTADGGSYLRGYQAINIPNISTAIYAVPTQPGQQPHLISLATFMQNSQQPGASAVILPPNAFKGGAASTNEISSKDAQKANAAGIVGMPAGGSQASIPHGYIVIDNSLNAPMSSFAVPSGDTWDSVEACTGTLVHRLSHAFSTEGTVNGRPYNALSSWLQTPRSGNFDPNSGPPIVDDDGNALLYDSSGHPITSKADAAKQIPFDTNPSDLVLATNQNSDPNGANHDADCVALATPTLPDNLSPFNRAYHPNANVPGGTSTGGMLTSAEQAKMYVLQLSLNYRNSGNDGGNFAAKSFPFTGLRLYPNNTLPSASTQYAWAPASAAKLPLGDFRVSSYGDPSIMGKVTQDGSLQQLIDQTTVSSQSAVGAQCKPYVRFDGSKKVVIEKAPVQVPSAEIRAFLKQRMNEIHPGASDSDLDNVMKQTLPLGSKFYVYYQQNNWVLGSNAPSWVTSIPSPDGVRHAFTNTYSVSGSMVDVQHDFGANDYPFNTNGVVANAVDCVSYQSSSGANGLLGYIKLFEKVEVTPGQ